MKKIPKFMSNKFDQYIVDNEGKPVAVIMTLESFDKFINDIRDYHNTLLKDAGIKDENKYTTNEKLKSIIAKLK